MAYQIQLLGLREIGDPLLKRKMDAFHSKMWRVDTEEDLFRIPEKLVAQIPSSEQYNIYFTVARCIESTGRILAEQWLIPWDIDDVGGGDTEEAAIASAERHARVACEAIGVLYEQTAVVFSGNGVQFFIKLDHPIMDDTYFETTREHYSALAGKVKAALLREGLPGKVDTSVYSKARLMRMPCTLNRKPNKPTRMARVLQPNLEPIAFDIVQRSGFEEIKSQQVVHDVALRGYPTPDTEAVITKCGFLKHCFEKPNEVVEYQWYAALAVVARLEKGRELCHQMSAGYKNYDHYETENKVDQALAAPGPRTCKNISSMWDGCAQCPHFKEVASPILLTGENYIKTKDQGFRITSFDKDGKPKPGKPAYDDLVKQFYKETPYITVVENKAVYTYNGVHWEEVRDISLLGWCKSKVVHTPASTEMEEFVKQLKAEEKYHRSVEWLDQSTERRMNFKNGVLNLDTLELAPHSKDYGFTFVLPYAYDSYAKSPIWDKYLQDITEGDQKMIDLLEQFGGYAIAGGHCYTQKALFLQGSGGNGKSVFPETLAAVVGEKNCTTVMLNELNNDQMRALLVNKLFNYADESPEKMYTDMFKTLVTGGNMTIKRVYQEPYVVRNKAKFIILANDLPTNRDTSDGLYDRLIIVPIKIKFRDTPRDNRRLKYDMWETELPGICNRLIAGYKKLVENKYMFDIPDASRNAVKEYREENNPILGFISECITYTDNVDDFVSTSDAYARYTSVCVSENEKPLTKTKFTQAIYRALPRISKDNRRRVGGKLSRVLDRCKLTEGEF